MSQASYTSNTLGRNRPKSPRPKSPLPAQYLIPTQKPAGICSVLCKTWDDFWQRTSINGVSNAGNARTSKVRRVVWIIIFIFFFMCTIYGVTDVISDYLDYPVVTSVSVLHQNQVHKMFD